MLQYANLTNLFVARTRALRLPRDAEVLAEFGESPAIALLRRHGSTFLLVGFDVLASNWPFEPSFVLFCYNALNYLRRSRLAAGSTSWRWPNRSSSTTLRPEARSR